ncbi:GNAT family N-acetyltransferase [Candidatus Saccharibacteria bacterium]|nr:GNAT family N-acetyltransferase [Candidatus Saccharibacteria bacterium]
MINIVVRKALAEDVAIVWKLGEHIPEFQTSDQAPTFWPASILQSCIGKDDVYFYVAVSGQQIVGFVIANCNTSLSKALIENIYVHPDHRGQGIGTRLAKQVIESAKADGYQFISVLTPPDDAAAIAAYKKAGFAEGETFLWLDVA